MVSKLHGTKKEITLLIIPGSSYKKKVLGVVTKLSGKFKAICYVNINQQMDALLTDFTKQKINTDKFLFVDAITKKSKEEANNCIYIGSPNALTELSVTIKKVLKTNKFDAFIFDSLSSLLTYHSVNSLIKFVHDLFAEVKKSNVVAVFTMQAGTDKNLLSDVSMFADHVNEVK
jgi:archaellum biogenesis ATPase FlaH